MTAMVGLIGLGLVGKAMAGRLLASGYRVIGFDTDSQACSAAGALGVAVARSSVEVARQCRVVLLSLPNSDVVGEVLWDAGLGEALRTGTLVLDTTTGRPADARENHARLAAQGLRFVDVTLSGSSAEIAAGKATALIGGREADADYRRIVETFAERLFFLGEPGAGCLAKLVTNHVMGLNRVALAEGLALGARAGMDAAQLLDVLRESAAYSRVIDMKGRRMVEGDFDPASRIAQHAKDVGLILELAEEVGAHAPLERVHSELLTEAIDAGWGDLDNAAIIKAYLERGESPSASPD